MVVIKKLLLLLVVLFGISSVCAVEYSGYDYEYYVKVSNIPTNGTIQAIPIYLVKSYDNYDFDKDGDIDSADREYAKTHGYIVFDPSKINNVYDVNFDDGREQLPAENVYLNKSKHVYAKYIVYTDSSEFYVRLHALYPHPLMTYTGNVSGMVPKYYDYWNDGSNIWVKLNLSAGESKTLYISTENAYPGNGDAVFEFFDDFEQLDTNKWNVYRYANDANNEVVFGSGVVYLTKAVESRAGLLVSKNDIKPPFVVHMKIKMGGGGSDIGKGHGIAFGYMMNDLGKALDAWYLGFPTGSNYYGYTIRFDAWPNYIGVRNLNTGKLDHLFYISTLDDYNWHNIALYLTEEKILKVVYDNNVVIQNYIVSPTGYNRIGIGASTGGATNNHIVDYIFIRKYAEQEPTATIEQIDSTTWKVVITNPNNYDLVDFQCRIPLAIDQDTSSDPWEDFPDSPAPLATLVATQYIYGSERVSPDFFTARYISVCCDIITPDKTMTLSTVTLNTNTFTISGANGAIVNQEYTLTFDREGAYIIDWGDGYTSATTTTTATHKYTTVGNYTILVTMYSTPWDIHRTKTVLVSSNVLNVTVNCYYEDGTRINDTSVTIIYILGQNTTQNGSINITTLANTIVTGKIDDIVRQRWVDVRTTTIDLYFPRPSDYVVQEVIKSYNPEDWIQIRLYDKVISENKGELNVYLTLGTVYKIYVNGRYYQDLIVDNIPDTIIVKTLPVHVKVLITEKPEYYEIYAISPEPRFYVVKVLLDNELVYWSDMVALPEGNILRIHKSDLEACLASENTTSYHTVAIFVYDGNKLVAWNKFLHAHFVPPPRTQTMAWMVLLALAILLGLTILVAREFMWATLILGSAAIYVMSTMKIFAVDFDLTTLSGLLFGLGVVSFIITNLKK